LVERMTVQRLSWDWVVRLHRYLEFFGKLASETMNETHTAPACWPIRIRRCGPAPIAAAGRCAAASRRGPAMSALP
jgi:hypothetical protein